MLPAVASYFSGPTPSGRLRREELATQIATQLLKLIHRGLQRSLADDANQHSGAARVVDLAISALRAVIARLERFVGDRDFLRTRVVLGAIAAMPWAGSFARLFVRRLRRVRHLVVLVRRGVRIRVGLLRENVFRLLGAGAKQHLSQASEGDVFVLQQVQQFTVRRDQAGGPIGPSPRCEVICPGSLVEFQQIVSASARRLVVLILIFVVAWTSLRQQETTSRIRQCSLQARRVPRVAHFTRLDRSGSESPPSSAGALRLAVLLCNSRGTEQGHRASCLGLSNKSTNSVCEAITALSSWRSSLVICPDCARSSSCFSCFNWWTSNGISAPRFDGSCFGKPLAKTPTERIAPDFLDRTVGPMRLVRLATSGGPAQQDPVGSPVTCAAESLWIHERFQEVDTGARRSAASRRATAGPSAPADARPGEGPPPKAESGSEGCRRSGGCSVDELRPTSQ